MTTLEVRRRIAVLYDVEELRQELGQRCIQGIEVFIDTNNMTEIEEVMASDPGKTRRALSFAMTGQYNNDLYGKEKISAKTANITAIKYKGKLNYRIYCQEIFVDLLKVKIILVKTHAKKNQKIDKKIASIIESVAALEFDFQIQ